MNATVLAARKGNCLKHITSKGVKNGECSVIEELCYNKEEAGE